MASLGELFVELGVFADTEELEKFNKGLKKVNNSIKVMQKELRNATVAISAAFYAINKLTNSLIENNQEFLNLTRNSDIALGTFQKWNNVGRMFGIKNAAQQLAGLNQRLYELKLTGQGAEGFILAGINPLGTDAEGVMEQLRNRVAGLDDTSATFLLNKMGLDPSMLHLLRMTRKEFEELGRTVRKYQLTETQRKQIQVFNRQLEIARIKLEYLKDRVVLKLLPLFVQFMHSLHRVSEGLKDIVKTIEKIPVLKNSLIALGAALLLYFHPILALFSGLYLIIDDIVGYMQGKKSVFGIVLAAMEDFQKYGFFSDNVPKWIQLLADATDRLIQIYKTFNWAGQIPQVKTQEEFDALFASSAPRWAKNVKAWGDSLFEPALPSTNGINQTLDNSYHINRNQDMTVNMNNQFYTQQPANDVYNEIFYLRNAFSPQ